MWIGLNVVFLRQAPAVAIQFGQALPRLLHTIMSTYPHWVPVFMSNIDLVDTYMRV